MIERRLTGRPRPYVLIGRGPLVGASPHDTGECLTRSRPFLMALRKVLDPDTKWGSLFPNGNFKANDKPWLIRRDAEDVIRTLIDDRPATAVMLPGVRMDSASIAAERIFNLLYEDKVLKHPTKRELRGYMKMGNRGVDGPLYPHQVWKVDTEERDSWIAARLLVLPEKWPLW